MYPLLIKYIEMDIDSESTATSVDENTENFCENPTRDTLTEGLMGLIKPTVDQLEERVRATRLVLYCTYLIVVSLYPVSSLPICYLSGCHNSN